MLTDDQLLQLAGKGAFERGLGYHRDDRVRLERSDAKVITGFAQGTHRYSLWIKLNGDMLDWDCECPAADDESFCKHLVAAVLTARDGAGGSVGDDESDDYAAESKPAKPARGRKKQPTIDLGAFLRDQSVERLAGWLLAFADDDPMVEKRLRLFSAANDPAQMKSALGKLLNTGGFLDYRRSLAYAMALDAVVAQLENVVSTDPTNARLLCEYVLGRLIKVIERADDSAGAIGSQVGAVIELHAHACTLAPPGKSFAKAFLQLQKDDGFGFFRLRDYWEALGAEGQLDYGRRVVADFADLKPATAESDRWQEDYSVVRRAESYAKISTDFDLLQSVLRRHLWNERDYLRVLESLQEAGRDREAMEWAEQAVKRFPRDADLRHALAACLRGAGLDEDAVDHTWHAFQAQPDEKNWDQLKQLTGDQWPDWRNKALDCVAKLEPEECSRRVRVLVHDGDVDPAIKLAQTTTILRHVLEILAQRIETTHPLVAGEFFLRLAKSLLEDHGARGLDVDARDYEPLTDRLTRASRYLPRELWQPTVEMIRDKLRRKRKLIALLDEAGL